MIPNLLRTHKRQFHISQSQSHQPVCYIITAAEAETIAPQYDNSHDDSHHLGVCYVCVCTIYQFILFCAVKTARGLISDFRVKSRWLFVCLSRCVGVFVVWTLLYSLVALSLFSPRGFWSPLVSLLFRILCLVVFGLCLFIPSLVILIQGDWGQFHLFIWWTFCCWMISGKVIPVLHIFIQLKTNRHAHTHLYIYLCEDSVT